MVQTMLAPETLPPVGHTAPGTTRRKVTIGGAAAGAGLVLFVAAGVFFVARGRKTEHQASTPAAAVWENQTGSPPEVLPAATLEPAAPPPGETRPAERAEPTEQTEAAAPASPAKVGGRPSSPPSVGIATKPLHASGSAPPASTASNGVAPAHSAPAGSATGRCDPPYDFDDHGNRLFKKDCL